jgi:PPOX class probable F420-dependent enzyme
MHHPDMAADLSPVERSFLAACRTAVLATQPRGAAPRLVPICFVLFDGDPPTIYTPLDEKPKRVADPHDLERVRDIVANPEVTLLVDRWSEDWSRLGWLRLEGSASLVEPGTDDVHHTAVEALRAKYPQYATHRLEDRPIIRIVAEGHRSWGHLAPNSA